MLFSIYNDSYEILFTFEKVIKLILKHNEEITAIKTKMNLLL